MIFEQIAVGGCQSYLLGCAERRAAVVIDPQAHAIDRYASLLLREGLRLRYVIDTHTHADHFSGAHELAGRMGARVAAHRLSATPHADLRLEDGDQLMVGDTRLRVLHTPGHTLDSVCLLASDRVFTGDTLLIGSTGRTDLPTGDPGALHDSLFGVLLKLDPALKVYPAHAYDGRSASTIGEEIASNPRLKHRDRAAFVDMMGRLNLSSPVHCTEALRVNTGGGKTIDQLVLDAAAIIAFVASDALAARLEADEPGLTLLDLRERDAFLAGHIPGARHLPRGELELRVNDELTDPTARIVTCCEQGPAATLAAATLRTLGFQRVAALDGGMKDWRGRGLPIELGAESFPTTVSR